MNYIVDLVSKLSIKGVYVVEIIKLYSGSKIILSGVN
jgi:hypothetical protein